MDLFGAPVPQVVKTKIKRQCKMPKRIEKLLVFLLLASTFTACTIAAKKVLIENGKIEPRTKPANSGSVEGLP